jgi:hypothetical protein
MGNQQDCGKRVVVKERYVCIFSLMPAREMFFRLQLHPPAQPPLDGLADLRVLVTKLRLNSRPQYVLYLGNHFLFREVGIHNVCGGPIKDCIPDLG